MLQLRLKQIPGVTINQDRLASRIGSTDGSLASVLNILAELNDDSVPEEERIFLISEENLLKQ